MLSNYLFAEKGFMIIQPNVERVPRFSFVLRIAFSALKQIYHISTTTITRTFSDDGKW